MTDRRRILITGATSGIGFAVAQRLASTDDVWIMGSRPETAHDAMTKLRDAGVSVAGATGIDAADEDAAMRIGRTLTLKDVASNISCPLYLVAGKLDRIVPWQDAERVAREAKGPVELVVIEDGNHVANNRVYKYRTQSADWMAQHLGLPRV